MGQKVHAAQQEAVMVSTAGIGLILIGATVLQAWDMSESNLANTGKAQPSIKAHFTYAETSALVSTGTMGHPCSLVFVFLVFLPPPKEEIPKREPECSHLYSPPWQSANPRWLFPVSEVI